VLDGRLQLGLWLTALAPHVASELSTAMIEGELHLTGTGTLDDGLRPLGQFSLSCEKALLKNPVAGWSLEGISFSGDFNLGPNFTVSSAMPFAFGIQTISTTRFGARAFTITGDVRNNQQLAVTNARIEIAGGEVSTLDSFSVSLGSPMVDTRVRINSVGLQDFVALIPSGLSAARGKLNGELRLTWNQTDGIELGLGTLALDEIEPTVIRLAPTPGFITGSMPERIALLPGFLGRIFYAPNPSLKDLREIELG
jgi:hypothetical protein